MKAKNTHTGILVGCDNRTSPDFKREIELRETKFWVSAGGKYSKENGRGTEMFPMYKLQLDSIKPIESQN